MQKLPAFPSSVENREECIRRSSTKIGFQIFSSQLLPQDLERIQIRIPKINGSPFIAVGIQQHCRKFVGLSLEVVGSGRRRGDQRQVWRLWLQRVIAERWTIRHDMMAASPSAREKIDEIVALAIYRSIRVHSVVG